MENVWWMPLGSGGKSFTQWHKKRHLPLALCWLALQYGTTCWDAQHTPAQDNDPNAVTEGALEKSRVIQTMEISTDFWEDFYFDGTEEKSSVCGEGLPLFF